MKTWIAGILLTAALIVFFSTYTGTPSGTQMPGKSGVVLTGENSETTEVVIRQSYEIAECETTPAETTEAAAEIIAEELEEKSLDDMLLMFWHGVAAVLIGEVSTLIVAVAWARIKGSPMSGGVGEHRHEEKN